MRRSRKRWGAAARSTAKEDGRSVLAGVLASDVERGICYQVAVPTHDDLDKGETLT